MVHIDLSSVGNTTSTRMCLKGTNLRASTISSILVHPEERDVHIISLNWSKCHLRRDSNPAHLDVIRRDEERRPADHDEEAAGQVVGDDVVGHLPLHVEPESGDRVVSGLLRHVVALVPKQLRHAHLETNVTDFRSSSSGRGLGWR